MRKATRDTPVAGSSRTTARSASVASGNRAAHSHRRQSSSSTRKTTNETLSSANSVLFLEQSHAKFSAPSKSESVFFDECNREIISLKYGHESTNKTRVIFQPTDRVDQVDFVLPVEKRILSIKMNSTRTVLAYHVERNIIEFINVHQKTDSEGQIKYVLDEKRYIQTSRAKNSKLIGFLWTGPLELVIITDLSVEYYHVEPNRRRSSHIKLFQSSTNWFVYQPPISNRLKSRTNAEENDDEDNYSILMVSTGSLGNSMQPYMFSRGKIVKLLRFDVEGSWQDSEKLELFERSITVAHLYGRVRLLVLQHESLNIKSRGAQIVLYTVSPETGATTKTHTLDLDVSGRFAINILDNLVIAHDQPSKSTFIFDIMIESTEKSDCPKHFVSLIDSRPIRQLRLDERNVDMYSLNWVFFQPNFIVDAKLGLLSTLQIDLLAMQENMQDNLLLLSFLANRCNSEKVIMGKCRQIVVDSYAQATSTSQIQANPLADVSSSLEILGRLVISAPELASKKAGSSGAPASRLDDQSFATLYNNELDQQYGAVLNQEDIQRGVFKWFETIEMNGPLSSGHLHFITSTLLEFIFVIRRYDKNVEFCIYEQLLKCLARGKQYYQIIQMIRSEIFKDSKQLACLLLSLRDEYRPAVQLGMDMLHRLPCGAPANLPTELM